MIIISILVLILIAGLFFALREKNMIIISILVLILMSGLLFKLIKGFIPFPIGLRHLINITIAPKDLYQPVALDDFSFYEQGFTKSYSVKPAYLDTYEIGFLIEKNGIESTYKFKGKIKVEFFWRDKFLFDSIITSMEQARYVQNDMTHYKEIVLFNFDVPLQGKYKNDLAVKLTVLEPDMELKRLSDSIKLYIAVSATP
ncbi:MAG: hypothetical protein HY808_02215 [Nitrospirae bacterium]|nr:hypothetical protein [Nitrospirota bacterium]MBI5057974.1 hypothetical protein [Nitrospirota bacterium]